jgi:hypothetical protein
MVLILAEEGARLEPLVLTAHVPELSLDPTDMEHDYLLQY